MILDLFAGPGGWSEGLRLLGLEDVGIEWDASACATRAAAGHRTVRADVAAYPTAPFVGKVSGLIASPPCQDFSLAGKRAGRSGERGQLIDDVPRWVDDLRPEWVACEQVPPALEVWEEFSRLFRSWGYSCWTGILNAADYGVPQTRKRAILLASRTGVALPPAPTHDKAPTPSLFDAELRPWVSMAQALGWGYDHRGSPTVTGGGGATGGAEPFGHAARKSLAAFVQRERSGDRAEEGFDPHEIPAQTLTSKARSWTVRTGTNSMKHSRRLEDMVKYERSIDLPAPTVDTKAGSAWTIQPSDGGGLVPVDHVDEGSIGVLSLQPGAGDVDGFGLVGGIDGDRQVEVDECGDFVGGHGSDDPQPAPVVNTPVALNTGRDWKPGGTRADAQQVPVDHPAPTIDGKSGTRDQWVYDRPATTVCADPRLSPPGWRDRPDDYAEDGTYEGKRSMDGAIKLTVADALTLQSFRPDYPVQGSRTSQFQQIGNAVPPLLAAHILSALIGVPMEVAA